MYKVVTENMKSLGLLNSSEKFKKNYDYLEKYLYLCQTFY